MPRDAIGGTPVLVQTRQADYAALFASNLFRLGRFHIVPSVRLDHERVRVDESVRPLYLSRALIDTTVSRTQPLFGVGLGNDFGHLNETYLNVSSGWRPVRYYDIGSPFANIPADTAPAVQKALSWEAGVHGTPVTDLFYDASVFWIRFHDRIETLRPSPTVAIERNSGDTHHRGFEGQLNYDFLAAHDGGRHLQSSGTCSCSAPASPPVRFPARSASAWPTHRATWPRPASPCVANTATSWR